MNLLLDTHILLWAAGQPERLPATMRELLLDSTNQPWFSAAILWEITIKRGLGRNDFVVDPRQLWRGLLLNGYRELPVSTEHALTVEQLMPLHKDPFDRLLLAQAVCEDMQLLTMDRALLAYPLDVVSLSRNSATL